MTPKEPSAIARPFVPYRRRHVVGIDADAICRHSSTRVDERGDRDSGHVDPPGVPCMMMRAGTSKGAYFLADDLPANPVQRDDLLLRLLGSPDERQIDGIGGGDPLTSKVAVVSISPDPDADIDYLFLQIQPDRAFVSAAQPCGNILAGVGPFAIERSLVPASSVTTTVRVRMVNTGGFARVTFATPGGTVRYEGSTEISGVPFAAAPIKILFANTAGSVCGSLLPTGSLCDDIDGTRVTCIDDGMPVVLVNADDLNVTGHERCNELQANDQLRARLEHLRLEAGELMGLGDVRDASIPKMILVSAPRHGGAVTTRSFIPHKCHSAIGVLAAVSVSTALALPGAVGSEISNPSGGRCTRLEHPTGFFDTEIVQAGPDGATGTAIIRTARKLFDGLVWPRSV